MASLQALTTTGCLAASPRRTGRANASCRTPISKASITRQAASRANVTTRAADVANTDASTSTSACGEPIIAFSLDQAFRRQHPGLLEALSLTTAGMTPATAAPLLRRMEAELPPVLDELSPSGDCIMVCLQPGLQPLLQRAAGCCEDALAAGRLRTTVRTAVAALRLLSRLHFGSGASVAPYAAVGVRCKQALKAAYDAGAEIRQEDIVELYSVCARASPWLWLTPYAGHTAASAVDAFITAGWASGEQAVRFAEAYSALVGSGRYTQVSGKYVRLVRAALQHPLSVDQVLRLLAATHALPVELSIALELHARSEPADCWYSALLQRLRQEQRAAAELVNGAVPMTPFKHLHHAAAVKQRVA